MDTPPKALAQQPVADDHPALGPPLLLLPLSVGLHTSHSQQGPSMPPPTPTEAAIEAGNGKLGSHRPIERQLQWTITGY